MDSGSAGWGIVILAVMLLMDAVVYGFGSAIRAVKTPGELRRESNEKKEELKTGEDSLQKRRAEKSIKLINRIMKDKADYIDTVQLITACVNMIVGAVYGIAFANFLRGYLQTKLPETMARPILTVLSVILAWVFILFIVLVFGVQIPKRLGSAHPDSWIQRCGPVIRVLMVITLPLTRLVSITARGILYLFGVRGKPLKSDVTEEEIRYLLDEGHERGVIDQSEAEMITNIFEFSEKEASEIMTQRSDMIAVDANETLSSAITFMLRQHNSRFPVYEGNIDNIIGIVHIRDAMLCREEHPEYENTPLVSCGSLVRDVVFVPETKNIDDLFRKMQKDKMQMVIVIDEYGQTAGLIAMEDILEEIVGNIMDEYDIDENHITATSNKNEYIIDGRTPLEDLTRRFGIEFDDDRFETVNGFLMSKMDKVPDPNDHFTTDYGGYRFHILSVADRQVQRVALTKLSEQQETAAQTVEYAH